ncbi:MAG: LysR substrate-binding domain-containing protein [Paracoccaceae bacterium]
MDTLGALESYVSAVQSGSLSGAARQRRMSQPAISQHITALESQFETRLLVRGRGGVRMTLAGEVAYKYAVSILEERAKLGSALETLADQAAGQITITANLAFSHQIVSDVISDFGKLHPDLKIEVRADDRMLDLEDENIDVALRSGTVGEGNGVVRKIGAQTVLHVATPAHLDAVGRPQTPDDLIKLNYIQYRSSDDRIATTLLQGTEIVQAPIKIGLTAQAPYLVFQALHGNLGYAKIPEFIVAESVKCGQLEVVLPDWKVPEKDLFVVFPSGGNQPPRVITLLHALMKRLDATKGVKLVASAKQLYV